MKFIKSTLTLIAICLPLLSLSQNNSFNISGTILNSQNEVLPFAEIQLKGTRLRTRSDEAGKYSFSNISAGSYVLRITLQGYHTSEKLITVNKAGNSAFDIVLEENQQNLNEVIVSASRRPESLSQTPSSVTVIGAKELETQSIISPNIANILSYSVPGLGTSTNQT